MNASNFIGRKQELHELRQQAMKRVASFIVVKGRRRIGKSTLIEEFANKYHFYSFAGLAPTEKTTKQSQLDEFAEQLSRELKIDSVQADNWSTLFVLLAKHTAKSRVVILLDEISWMGSKDPDFLGKLKNAWDIYFKKNPQLMLFICGSASVWIDKNILANTAFVGRVSYTLTLDELSLPECNEFWKKAESKISAYDKFKILSITGGIPRYLEEIRPQASSDDNIRQLCFKKGGLLTQEFSQIFSDLFGHRSDKYKQIIRHLIAGSLEYAEICTKLKVHKSGRISEYLNDLVTSGFVSRDNTWDIKSGLTAPLLFKYRLKDNYLRFYLKYIENKLPMIEKNSYALASVSGLPGWASIMGLQFENLVLNNREFVHQALNLSPEEIVVEGAFFQKRTVRQSGCQIDLMIQTRTNILYICEIKFSRDVIKKEIIKEVETKIKALSAPRGTSFCPVLIHVNGVHDSVIDSDYFTKIIDFSEALR